jgi:hypothetical protein
MLIDEGRRVKTFFLALALFFLALAVLRIIRRMRRP